jgi:hypothetical protein
MRSADARVEGAGGGSAGRLFLASALPAFALYLATLAPTVTPEDSGELITAAYTLGIAHPRATPSGASGEALHPPPLGDGGLAREPALGRPRGLRRGRPRPHRPPLHPRLRRLARRLLVFAASRASFWSQCVITEVYTLTILFILLLVFLVLRYEDTWKRRWLYAAAFVLGLGLTAHTTLGRSPSSSPGGSSSGARAAPPARPPREPPGRLPPRPLHRPLPPHEGGGGAGDELGEPGGPPGAPRPRLPPPVRGGERAPPADHPGAGGPRPPLPRGLRP